MNDTIWLGLGLATLAGFSTVLGSLLATAVRNPGPRFMVLTLGFSAGVMLLVSFSELLPHGVSTIGFLPAHLAFFSGMALMFIVDLVIPHQYLGGEKPAVHERLDGRYLRTGVFIALGIAIHNFPEGMATFAGTMESPRLGLAIAAAVAIHNIPEGLAVSGPIYAATGSRRKAFLWSFVSGMSEPLGAVLTALILLPFLSSTLLGIVLAGVAGVMVFISLDELVPVACSLCDNHLPIVGVLAGMVLMSVSLWLLG
ncbi:MAG: zinc transporter ZupT [Anaerolineae bacterium]|nr:zinc transporter ZupT [Anaerolineae bacterium]